MKSENGITLYVLVVYVIMFTIIIGLLSSLSNYIYGNIKYVNDNSIDVSEFNKFNVNFLEDVKNNSQVKISEITNDNGNEILQIIFENGNQYNYFKNEKSIYKNKQKIADDIQFLSVQELVSESNKKYIQIHIKIGAKEKTNYEKTINYVLKYW